MKYLLLISCLILCSCSPKEETELVNEFEPCSSNSVEPDPLIYECPPEDIAECPISSKISKKELSFDAQGGVRCITCSNGSNVTVHKGSIFDDNQKYDCEEEDGFNESGYVKLKCSWLTAMRVSNLVVHISVDKNETGMERKYYVVLQGSLYSWGDEVLITQSAE